MCLLLQLNNLMVNLQRMQIRNLVFLFIMARLDAIKKGVKPSVTRLHSRLPPSRPHVQQAQDSPHPIGVNFQSACSRTLKIGGIQNEENKSQKLQIYLSRTNGTRC